MNDGSIALVGGRIRTFDASNSVAEAIYIERGVIAALGTTESVRALVPDDVQVIDLDGRLAVPGLIDAHSHVELSTLADHFWVIVRELDVPTILERLAEAVAKAAPGDWVVGQGTFGQEMPTREELDRIAPDNPVVMRQSMHAQVANSVALRKAGIDRAFVSGNVGARALRGPDGEPSGVTEEGFDYFPVPRPSEEDLARALRAEVLDGWVRHGVTTIHELPASTGGTRAWQRLSAEDALPCRIVLNPILAPGHQPTVESVDSFAALGLMTGFGSPWLRLGSLKLFLDGVGCAALHHAQLSGPPSGWGLQNFLYLDLVRVLARAREARVQVWMHAWGDAVHSMAMDAIEEVNTARGNGDHRTRIEHIGLAKTDETTFPRLRAMGAIPVPTAAFMHFEPDDREAGLPEGGRLYPYKSLLAAGLRPPGNSDTAGTQPFATNPWHGISLMQRRVNRNGTPFSRDEAIDVEAGFRIYTANGAYAGFDERLKGSLEVGKLGDVAVFADDPFELEVERLPDLEADLTIVGGRVLHDRNA